MKRVAIIYSGAKHWGGVETYLELLFANADRAKVNLTLLSLGSWPLTRKLPNAEYRVRTFAGSRFRPQTIFEISKSLREDDIDLVVSQGTVANAYARAASLLSGVSSLVVVHSDAYFDYPNAVTRAIYCLIEKLTRFPSKHYIAVSEYLKQKLIKSGIPANKISVILNGVKDPGQALRHSSTEYKFSTGSGWKPGGPIIIGSIGRLHKVKNYAELIRACSLLKIENWKLKIIGEGSERENLEGLIKKLKLEDRVELLGNVDNAREQLSQIDIYVQPSLSEGFGLTVIEAMLAGKPVIVSPSGSLPEIVQDGKTGIIMPDVRSESILEAINNLTKDPDKSNELAIAGQKYAREHFGVENWAKQTADAFEKAAR